VTPGVPTTFLQQLVHLDSTKKEAAVLGEVHKQYVVTPDVDRLLAELFENGGKTHMEKEEEESKARMKIKAEGNLFPMKGEY
jgi:DNA-directed RNA polymerase III subunit RPC4